MVVHEAGIQDRDGAPQVLKEIRYLYSWLRHIFAGGGYAGDKLRQALRRLGDWSIEIVKRADDAKGFVVVRRRWVVERTFGWLGRCRRLAKDFEASIDSAVARVFVASIRTLTRKLARYLAKPTFESDSQSAITTSVCGSKKCWRPGCTESRT